MEARCDHFELAAWCKNCPGNFKVAALRILNAVLLPRSDERHCDHSGELQRGMAGQVWKALCRQLPNSPNRELDASPGRRPSFSQSMESIETSWGRVFYVAWQPTNPCGAGLSSSCERARLAVMCLVDETMNESDAFQYLSIIKREVDSQAAPADALRSGRELWENQPDFIVTISSPVATQSTTTSWDSGLSFRTPIQSLSMLSCAEDSPAARDISPRSKLGAAAWRRQHNQVEASVVLV